MNEKYESKKILHRLTTKIIKDEMAKNGFAIF